VGIRPGDVEVLGALDDVYTMATDFLITPYVGVLPADYAFRPDPREVSEIFTVTLEDLMNPRYHEVTQRQWRGGTFPVDAITAGPHTIWGATHAMTIGLIESIRALD
jgi:hypothetical protein